MKPNKNTRTIVLRISETTYKKLEAHEIKNKSEVIRRCIDKTLL